MKNFDSQNLYQVLSNFEALDESTKQQVIAEITKDWQTCYNEFSELITKHPELAKNIRNLRVVQSRNGVIESDYFQKLYGYDPFTEEPNYIFDEESFKEAKHHYENWNDVVMDYQKELARLENAVLMINRNKKIETLKRRFEKFSKNIEIYKILLEDTKAYNHYKRNPNQIATLRYSIMEQVGQLADEFLQNKLQTNPQLVCYQSQVSPGDWENHPQYLCSQLRLQLLKENPLDIATTSQEKQ